LACEDGRIYERETVRAASAGLIALLNSGNQFLMADLYTITLSGGFVVRYTSADTDLTYGGSLFSRFMIGRSKTKVSVGVDVDTLNVKVNAAPTDLLNGGQWLPAARNGALDGATLKLEKIFMPTWGDTSLGAIILFQGRVSDVELGRSEAAIIVKSELELLDTQLPRNFYQSSCLNTLFDNGCGLVKSAYAVTSTVSTATTTQINSALAQAAGYFSLGTIRFTSGANNGITRSVRAFAGGAFTLALPLVTAPSPGDSFTAYPGCDKTKATCEGTKFGNNVVNFRGFPFIPDPETAT
jgi:uncharacterized phage protein (TIGR02218 family)